MAEYRVPGVGFGLLDHGQQTLRGFGVTSLDDPQPITADTLFTIASITKTMTATAVMKLVEEGRVDLRAPVRTYLPDFRVLDEETSRTVSLWHLLTHTPGWEGQLSTEDVGTESLARFVAVTMPTLPQLAKPGEVWSYNNAGFALTGRIIEAVTGRSIHDALRELVFTPLGLSRTFTRLTEAMTFRFSLGHRDRENRVDVIRPWQTTSSTTAGGVMTSVADLMRYARFHLGDGTTAGGLQYLSPARLELMRTPQIRKNSTTDDMGVGWHLRTVGGVVTVAHGGTLNGHCLMVQLVPSRQLAFAVLTNHQDGWRLVQDVERAILQRFAGVVADARPGDRAPRGQRSDDRPRAAADGAAEDRRIPWRLPADATESRGSPAARRSPRGHGRQPARRPPGVLRARRGVCPGRLVPGHAV